MNCDEPDIRKMLSDATSTSLKTIISHAKLVIVDEVQRVRNNGLTLKLIIDEIPGVQLIISGS
ncbi:MAG: AAA family ATPase [Balneolaceae bacterium]